MHFHTSIALKLHRSKCFLFLASTLRFTTLLLTAGRACRTSSYGVCLLQLCQCSAWCQEPPHCLYVMVFQRTTPVVFNCDMGKTLIRHLQGGKICPPPPPYFPLLLLNFFYHLSRSPKPKFWVGSLCKVILVPWYYLPPTLHVRQPNSRKWLSEQDVSNEPPTPPQSLDTCGHSQEANFSQNSHCQEPSLHPQNQL